MKRNEYNIKWVEDLRSGDYKQCNGRLKRAGFNNEPESYCCLGVAVESLGGDWAGNYGYGPVNPLSHSPDDSGLNNEARELIGLSGADEGVCVSLNDTHRCTFAQIADVIERACQDDIGVDQAAVALRVYS